MHKCTFSRKEIARDQEFTLLPIEIKFKLCFHIFIAESGLLNFSENHSVQSYLAFEQCALLPDSIEPPSPT